MCFTTPRSPSSSFTPLSARTTLSGATISRPSASPPSRNDHDSRGPAARRGAAGTAALVNRARTLAEAIAGRFLSAGPRPVREPLADQGAPLLTKKPAALLVVGGYGRTQCSREATAPASVAHGTPPYELRVSESFSRIALRRSSARRLNSSSLPSWMFATERLHNP